MDPSLRDESLQISQKIAFIKIFSPLYEIQGM